MTASVDRWLVAPLATDVQAIVDRLARHDDVRRIAIMPDVHVAAEVGVGMVVATASTLIPAAVGGDIGCGMLARAFDAHADVLADRHRAAIVLSDLIAAIPILRHHRSTAPRLPPALADTTLSQGRLEALKQREAALQLGTLGRGNHFVEFQSDDDERLWVMIHSGSRGLGQAIREAHEPDEATSGRGLRTIAADSVSGHAYQHDMEWALDYAAASRHAMAEAVAQILADRFGIASDDATTIACHHNFVRCEHHGDEALWVHRKGAISARDGEPGIVPGSMGTSSHHVVGRGCAEAMMSSSHGAGRTLARGVARRQISTQQLHGAMQGIWFDHRLAPRLRDEAPMAYKDIDAVMHAQRELTRTIRRLRPRLVYKGA